MLDKVYETPVLPYDLYDGRVAPYNAYLLVPPRIYMETTTLIRAIIPTPQTGLVGENTVKLFTHGEDVYNFAPGGYGLMWSFDGATGEYKGREQVSATFFIKQWSMSVAGTLYSRRTGGVITSHNLDTLEETGFEILPEHWDPPDFDSGAFCIDEFSDIILMAGDPSNQYAIAVRSLSSGAILREIRVCGKPQVIAIGAIGSAYVMSSTGIITVVDYIAGYAVGVLKQSGVLLAGESLLAWDNTYKRLLFCQIQEDAVDGACNTKITGYRSTPVAVGLTPPLPLRAPRTGRHVPVVVRAYGDCGELVGGLAVDAVETGAGVLLPASATTDRSGYAEFSLDCAAEGASQIDASAEV